MGDNSGKIILLGIIESIVFVGISLLIRDTVYIWLLTRLYGLLSYVTLFLTTLIGELRMLRKVKGDLTLFRFHKPLAIFSTFLVILHGLAGFADNYKWGKLLVWTQYLGFSFGDKWLSLLSFGTLAFYLMLIVGLTSATRSIQFMGFRNWKRVHYFSYVCFLFAFVHGFNLGTDVKTSFLAPIVRPFMLITGFLVLGLLLARIAHAVFEFDDQLELNVAMVFFVLLVVGAFLGGMAWHETGVVSADVGEQVMQEREELRFYENVSRETEYEVAQLRQRLGVS